MLLPRVLLFLAIATVAHAHFWCRIFPFFCDKIIDGVIENKNQTPANENANVEVTSKMTAELYTDLPTTIPSNTTDVAESETSTDSTEEIGTVTPNILPRAARLKDYEEDNRAPSLADLINSIHFASLVMQPNSSATAHLYAPLFGLVILLTKYLS